MVTIRDDQTVDLALEEKKMEKDLKLIERIEKEEKTKSENDENWSTVSCQLLVFDFPVNLRLT